MTRRIPTCHPDRLHQAKGLCAECYMREYDRNRWEQRHQRKEPSEYAENYRQPPRKEPRVNECGHPERAHYSFGMCKNCYQKAKRDGTLAQRPATCHPDRAMFARGLCESCYRKRRYDEDPETAREQANKSHRSAAKRLRDEMLAAYGGQCTCPKCPETNSAFLTLEHINGDGAEHRRQVGSHTYADLRRRGWPKDGYTLLCWNCNAATKGGKTCPHME